MVAALDSLECRPSDAVAEVDEAAGLSHVEVDEARLLVAVGRPLLGVYLQVEQPARRQGNASTLIAHAAAVGLRDGCTHAVLTPATVPFYEHLGFELERSRPDRWFYLPA